MRTIQAVLLLSNLLSLPPSSSAFLTLTPQHGLNSLSIARSAATPPNLISNPGSISIAPRNLVSLSPARRTLPKASIGKQLLIPMQMNSPQGSSADNIPEEKKDAKPEDPGKKHLVFGLSIRRCVMILLVIQNACQMVSMRYSRVVSTAAGGVQYLPSTAVVASECLKLLVCLCIIAYEHKGKTLSFLNEKVVVDWKDTLKVTVPALVYTVQNNLLYVATSNLDAATCQITYQLKILTTAMFAVTMLGRRISPGKWGALTLLVVGIVCVQLPQITSSAATAVTVGNPVVGLAAVVGACFMSGFAGIWFEKILKGSDTSIWVRNVQLGLLGLPLALAAAFVKDGAAIAAHGFLGGYSPFVWAVVAQVGLGGLIVALVVRYADNILKGFATSLSIIASGLISYYLVPALAFTPTSIWFVGTALVIAATYLYSIPDPPGHQQFAKDSKA